MSTVKKLAIKVDAFTDAYNKFNRKIARKIANLILKYNNWVMDEKIYANIRKLTKPLHWAWIGGWLKWVKDSYYEMDPFKKPGIYIITGEPGSGKSSLAMEIMHRTLLRTGKGSYINTAIEVPRIDEKTYRLYLHHPLFEITDFFDKGKIVAYPNHFKFAAMHIDEAHRVWQYRENQSNSYMDTFKPFMEYAVGVRHYIGHIYIYTQMEKVDTQLMSLGANNILDVQVKKGFDYNLWLENGKFETTILGWNLTFFKATASSGGWNKTPVKTIFLPRTFDLKYFDTFNLRKGLKDVKFDNRYKTTEVYK